MKIGIVGCGLIGHKRAQTISLFPDVKLVVCADLDLKKAQVFAERYVGCAAVSDYREAINFPEIDAVIIATPHQSLAEVATFAVQQKKHVLIEKPAARNSAELNQVIALAEENNIKVQVGFNHRYHRAFQKARELVDAGAIGELMFIRARYGHGGRVGYDKEWRANPALSGGGELIDQGVHLIDLSRWFLGEFVEIKGHAVTYFWDMPVEDNGFLLLKTGKNQVAFLQASCTEWKNTFSFEIYGKLGKLEITGLGGSYGVERLAFYKMLPEMGPPETVIFEYPMADNSWQIELGEFLKEIKGGHASVKPPSLNDAQKALEVVEEIYRQSGLNFLNI
jgi:predicted dehydrogenase